MRQIIPKEIFELQEICAPYLHYVEGQEVVFVPDTPLDIIETKKKVEKWFEEHDRDNY